MSLKRTMSMRSGAGSSFKAKKPRLNPSLASQVSYQVRRQIAAAQEMKFHDTPIAAGQSSIGGLYDLTNMGQGDTNETRNGNKIKPRWIDARLNVEAADNINTMRLIFFQWHALATPTPDEILDPTLVGATWGPFTPIKIPGGMFRILSDRTYLVENGSGGAVHAKANVRLSPNLRDCEYEGTGTTGPEHVYLLAISDSGVSPHPPLTGVVRVAYTDG